jgi:hypothetical protein
MNLHYFLSCTLAAGSLVISPGLEIPVRLDTRGPQTITVAEVTYDASVVGVESFLIEKWRSMGFSMPIDGQTFTWDEYVEPVTDNILAIGDLMAFTDDDGDDVAGIVTYINAAKAALLVYVPVAPGVAQYMGVQGSKILLLIRPKAKVAGRKI